MLKRLFLLRPESAAVGFFILKSAGGHCRASAVANLDNLFDARRASDSTGAERWHVG